MATTSPVSSPVPEYPQLHVSPEVVSLFRNLILPPKGVQLFCNTFDAFASRDASGYLSDLTKEGVKVSAVVRWPDIHNHCDSHINHDQLSTTLSPNMEQFNLKDQFHLGLSAPPFLPDYENDVMRHIEVADLDRNFECSRTKTDGRAALHLMAIESLLHAVHIGGYFAAILPKRWVGRNMKYMKWWADRAALVARVRLPGSAVSIDKTTIRMIPYAKPVSVGAVPAEYEHRTTVELAAPGDWELLIWTGTAFFDGRPDATGSGHNRKLLNYAEFRYQPFIFTLETLTPKSIEKCCQSFRKCEWWPNHLRWWKKLLEKQPHNSWCGTDKNRPHDLPDPKETWRIPFTPKNELKFTVVETLQDIKKLPFAIHVKPGRKTKLSAYNDASKGLLHDVRFSFGMNKDLRTGEDKFRFVIQDSLTRLPVSEVAEALLPEILNRGAVACMTAGEYKKLLRQDRWLSIQLTPIERTVPIKAVAEVDQTETNQVWETLYEDTGMEATHPELLHMWTERAKKTGLDTISFDFQFRDLVLAHAPKQCIVNGNVMGLGKTRETIMLAYLRGCTKILIICPSKLIGEWQKEIDETFMPFIRRQRKDWQGKVLDASTNVIQFARDCRPENLRMFNIISYDTLKRTPRDGVFYKCPKCGMITYSAKSKDKGLSQYCPGNPKQEEKDRCNYPIQSWKQECRRRHEQDGRDEDGNIVPLAGKLVYQKYKVGVSSGKKIHWDNPEGEPFEIVDTRPPKPDMVLMEPQTNVYKKVNEILSGYEEKMVGERYNQVKVKVPLYIKKTRKFHAKWTFSEILRHTFNFIAIDEAPYIKNYNTSRAKAVYHLTAQTRVALTGTLIKGYPQSVIAVLNWTLNRLVYPNYRPYDPMGERRFLERYQTLVYIGAGEDANGNAVGGKPKQIPKINNAEQFQTEIAPFMRRHTRNEPEVLKDISQKFQETHTERCVMDPEHQAYYKKWLDKFIEWWEMMKKEEEGKEGAKGELITKITYLINADTCPHFMLENVGDGDLEFKKWAYMIGPYKGPITAKMKKAQEIVLANIAKGDKTLVASIRRRNLDLGHKWADKSKLASMIIDGRVPLTIKASTNRSERQELVDNFNQLNYHVAWCGLTAMAEGMNIPTANHGIVMDYSWEPTDWKQFIGRMIRPQQKKTIHSYFLTHKGSISDYMAAWCYLKAKSGDEGLDYMEFDDFTTAIIPDIHQYADALLIDGAESLKRKMWLAVDHLRAEDDDEGGEEKQDLGGDDDDDDGNGGNGGGKPFDTNDGDYEDGDDWKRR